VVLEVRRLAVAGSFGVLSLAAGHDPSGGLDALLPQAMEQAVVPGAQVAVIRDGAIAWHRAFGLANADTRAAVTEETVFEAASLTKPLFAYAVLKLVDEGRLDLDAPLARYLPGSYDVEGDDRLQAITAREVLSHRTGFPNWRPEGQPLAIRFTPGERFSYSGEGFVYLGAAVERVTGETLEAFVKCRVFDPLGMSSSSLVWQPSYAERKAYGHGPIGNVAGRRTPWRANPAASLHTTALDYARFVVAAIGGNGLRPETARQMLSPQARLDEAGFDTANAKPTGREAKALAWGLGWGLEREADRWSVWHWGDNGPMKAYVAASPSTRTGVVLFLDSQNGLALVPAVIRQLRGSASPVFSWLKVQEPVPALGRFARTLRDQGAARALDEYRATRAARPDEPPLSEETVNAIGYALLRERKLDEAVRVFRQNVTDHPESWNAHDSLGEALAAAGDTAGAIEAYERSLARNPANAGGAAVLRRLRAGGAAKD
jgi:CubicO group peptidase (beta-lactamase class C family)